MGISQTVEPLQRGDIVRTPGESAYPGLWMDLIGFWVPQTGPSGDVIYDYSSYRANAQPVSGSPITWAADIGGWTLDCNESMWTVDDTTYPVYDWGTSDFTLYARGKHDGAGGAPNGSSLCAKDVGSANNRWSLQFQTSNSALHFKYGNALLGTTGRTEKDDARWHTWVTVREGNEGRYYIDGSLDDTQSTYFSSLNVSNIQDFQIGGSDSSRTAKEWIGRIGPIGIWLRPLTFREIRVLTLDPLAPLRPRRRMHVGKAPAAPAAGLGQLVEGGLIDGGSLVGGKLVLS